MEDKFYMLVMFPYPSGDGLHIGHSYNYAIMDTYCRWKNFMGVETFQPFGYDAFGLPAENYAKKHGKDPKEVTYTNIENFRNQMAHMDTNYDERLITCDPSYQRWTQWVFTKLKDAGLAYKSKGNVNYCIGCETVLANEQVEEDTCKTCGADVIQKEMEQWYFKITDYKDRLIKNLDWIDYPEKTKKQQRHWLETLSDWCVSRQRSWGCPIPIEGETDTLDTFVDSSFYFLRYLTDSNDELIPKEDYKQVDLYVGGNEHACMHLIYARFIHMFLYDQGIVPEEEPFKKLIHQGMITKDGRKMSKSIGNVVNPLDYNVDELRMYLMFIGPYTEGGNWNDKQIIGIRRALGRWKRWISNTTNGEKIDLIELKDTINGYMESFKFNLVVSTLMIFYNENKNKVTDADTANELSEIIKCFAPGFGA